MDGQLSIPWVEKYRPKEIGDLVGNSDIIERLSVLTKEGNIPNLILAGPPGTGKTSSLLILAKSLLGDALKESLLELNASDERGIDVVRNKIKLFAQKKVSLPPSVHKIVLLDEADSITPAAQHALRRTIELHAHTTRFVLSCNSSAKIIEAIQSRCAVLRFGRIPDEAVLRRLAQIAASEGVRMADDGLQAVVFTADGDLRLAVNNLQAAAAAGAVSQDSVFAVCDVPQPAAAAAVLAACGRCDVAAALAAVSELHALGYSPHDIITTLFRVAKTAALPEFLKLQFIKEISFTHIRIIEGCASLLQLHGLVARMSSINMNPNLLSV